MYMTFGTVFTKAHFIVTRLVPLDILYSERSKMDFPRGPL